MFRSGSLYCRGSMLKSRLNLCRLGLMKYTLILQVPCRIMPRLQPSWSVSNKVIIFVIFVPVNTGLLAHPGPPVQVCPCSRAIKARVSRCARVCPYSKVSGRFRLANLPYFILEYIIIPAYSHICLCPVPGIPRDGKCSLRCVPRACPCRAFLYRYISVCRRRIQ